MFIAVKNMGTHSGVCNWITHASALVI